MPYLLALSGICGLIGKFEGLVLKTCMPIGKVTKSKLFGIHCDTLILFLNMFKLLFNAQLLKITGLIKQQFYPENGSYSNKQIHR